MQEVSGVYTCPVLDTDELKMSLRARNVSVTLTLAKDIALCSRARQLTITVLLPTQVYK